MCRLLGYVGPRTDLASLLVAPSHSLLEQSWAPADQHHGTINADGWGVGWYAAAADDRASTATPARYRSVLPMWSDPHLTSLLPHVSTEVAVSVVRSATPPSATELTSTPPFAVEQWLLAHNGAVEGWRDGVGERLRRSLPLARAQALAGSTDTEVVFALVLAALDEGVAVPDALARAIVAVRAAAPARLNLVLADGETVWATRCGDTLSVLHHHDLGAPATWIASEPFDDDARWTSVAEDHLVTATTAGLVVEPLHEGSTAP